jgi:hypothetical protein
VGVRHLPPPGGGGLSTTREGSTVCQTVGRMSASASGAAQAPAPCCPASRRFRSWMKGLLLAGGAWHRQGEFEWLPKMILTKCLRNST